MKRYAKSEKDLIGSGGTPRYIKIPCDEGNILYLERICMVPGFHKIKVTSLASGREIIRSMLQALNWHQDVAYITTEQFVSNMDGTNVLQELKSFTDQESMELFLFTAFNYDFLLIEFTDELKTNKYFRYFQKLLVDYAIDKTIPIIYMMLEQN